MLTKTKKIRIAAAVLCVLFPTLVCGEETAKPYWPTFADSLKSGGSGPRMIGVNGGRFRMGCVSGVACRDNEPVREVSVAPFALSVYEITRGEFRRFVKLTGYVTDGERAPKTRAMNPFSLKRGCLGGGPGSDHGGINLFSWQNPDFQQTDEHPAVCISWGDAQAYVRWLAAETGRPYRLPSETEWEYAARAGASGPELEETELQKLLHCASLRNVRRPMTEEERYQCLHVYWQTVPVGSAAPNANGVYGIDSNAAEWVEDCWHPHFRGAPVDGSAWTQARCRTRTMRGVAFSRMVGAPWEGRATMKGESWSLNLSGFRVALPTSD